MDDQQAFRLAIFDLLNTISDMQEQLRYEESVPIANVPAELVCMWFDDYYHPESKLFLESFDDREMKLLEEFHEYYKKMKDKLPNTSSVKELQKSPVWNEVANKASKTLKTLSED
ncbi:MAG: hypothetical protein GY861_01375 [bacterium]|nr:hypothetical protein [bacterium]